MVMYQELLFDPGGADMLIGFSLLAEFKGIFHCAVGFQANPPPVIVDLPVRRNAVFTAGFSVSVQLGSRQTPEAVTIADIVPVGLNKCVDLQKTSY